MAQGFVGRMSMVADVYLMNSQKEFVQTLTDTIRHRGAMDLLISDRGEAEISNRVKDILRMYAIEDFQSEPHHKNQNFFERWWQVIKRLTITILDWSGANANEWFLVLEYVIYIRNRTAVKSLGWMTPLEKLTGQTPDISIMLQMPYRQPVFFKEHPYSFPNSPYERFGYFVGFSTSVGHSNTFKILDEKTGQILFRSRVRLPKDVPNTRALKAYDVVNKPFDRGKKEKVIPENKLSDLAQAKFTDLNHPEKEEVDKIGNVPLTDLTPNERESIPSEEKERLVEDEKHPNLQQHPIRFMSDTREGKLIPMPIEDLVNRSFLLPIEKDGTRRRAVVKNVDSKAYEDYMNHVQTHPDFVKFRIKVGDEEYDKLVEYNKVLNVTVILTPKFHKFWLKS